jgi:hypothetical protein
VLGLVLELVLRLRLRLRLRLAEAVRGGAHLGVVVEGEAETAPGKVRLGEEPRRRPRGTREMLRRSHLGLVGLGLSSHLAWLGYGKGLGHRVRVVGPPARRAQVASPSNLPPREVASP